MNKGRKKWEIVSPFPFRRQTLEHDGVTFPRCLRKSMAELKTEPWCWFPGSCLILKAFPSAKSQRNESSNTQTATWGLSSGSALPFPTTACVGKAPRRPGSLLGQKGPSPKCPWVWRAIFLQHGPWQMSCDLMVSAGHVLTHSTGRCQQHWCTMWTAVVGHPHPPKGSLCPPRRWLSASSQVAHSGPRGKKTKTTSLSVSWREQRNKLYCSWKSMHYGEISQSWQEYYFD